MDRDCPDKEEMQKAECKVMNEREMAAYSSLCILTSAVSFILSILFESAFEGSTVRRKLLTLLLPFYFRLLMMPS
jgi:hypothetical protein